MLRKVLVLVMLVAAVAVGFPVDAAATSFGDFSLPLLGVAGVLTEVYSPSASIVAPAVNQVTKTDLVRKVRTMLVQMRLRCTMTLAAGPATAIVNGGSPWALFDRVGIDENGKRHVDIDPRLAIIMTQMFSAQDPNAGRVRASNLANGAYNLEESLFLPFTGHIVASPMESIYMERDTQASLSAFVNQSTASGLNKIVQSPGTAAITAVTVGVSQRFDLERMKRTVLMPVLRQVEIPVNGASTELPFKIESSRYLQFIIVQQDAGPAGEVSDIINSLSLRADGRDIFGPGQIEYEALQAAAQFELSGDIVPRGYLPFWFRKGGRLGNVLNPNSVTNLKFLFNCQPSVSAGAANSTIRLLLGELERVDGLTAEKVGYQI